MSDFVDEKTQAMLPPEQPAEGAPAKTKTVVIEGVAEDAKLDEEKLADDENKKVIVKESPGEKEISETVVEGPKLDEEMLRNEEMKKFDVKESSGEESIETEKDSGEEKFDFSKNIYKKKEESPKNDINLGAPNEVLPAPAAENAQNELAQVLAPQAADSDLEPRFPKRNRRVSKRYPETEFEMKEPKKHRK
ncbi:hypothetical protein CAEBREN_11015 [Caenorhabditis brenneri]|uniref:Uncharacterized protein n=1 Tax=Caenorhabditis brenneri TaxID=135651 RepID=G0PDE0_CAEBE|nr:hypothetical protein CAEBREN_11015 [Caenorhabditis brenneri]